MHRHLALLALVPLLAFSALIAPRLLAQGTLDQSNTSPAVGAFPVGQGFTTVIGQTFTAGRSGLLDSAALDLSAATPGTTATITLYATTGALPHAQPSGPALASATITIQQTVTPTDPTQYSTVTFAPAAVVVAGQVYALVLGPVQTPGGIVEWFVQSVLPYPRGNSIVAPSGLSGSVITPAFNFDFQTFVTPTSAASVTLSATPGTAQPGQPATFTAVVGCSTGTPSGSVSFSSNGAVLAIVPVSNGAASVTLIVPAAGLLSVLATYNGDPICLAGAAAAIPPGSAAIVIINPPVMLGIAIKGCGALSPSAATFVNQLQAIPVTAIPCAGSTFVGWTGGPCSGTRIDPCDIAPNGTTTITATFAP